MDMATNSSAKKSAPKRVNKPRTFYMVYKGQLEAPPQFAYDRDALIDVMLNDRDVKVEKITIEPRTRRKSASADAPVA